MRTTTPRLEINLTKIQENAQRLVQRLGNLGVSVTGVTKVALGDPKIAHAMVAAGIKSLGDSRIENIQKMREAGIQARFTLIRTPLMSKVDDVVQYADCSFNTELSVIERISQVAVEQGKIHDILLMVELGDLREGIPLDELNETLAYVIGLPGIQFIGIGSNLACLGGVKPDQQKMKELLDIAESVENKFNLKLECISGGNSANLEWLLGLPDSGSAGRINNLRLGESIFLGCETLNRNPIEGLHLDAITLVSEVIESKKKPAFPWGEICQDAFGETPEAQNPDRSHHKTDTTLHRAILGIGRQDVLVTGITAVELTQLEVLGSSSDHIVITCHRRLVVGEEVRFRLNYGALLAAMTSPFVAKEYRNSSNP